MSLALLKTKLKIEGVKKSVSRLPGRNSWAEFADIQGDLGSVQMIFAIFTILSNSMLAL